MTAPQGQLDSSGQLEGGEAGRREEGRLDLEEPTVEVDKVLGAMPPQQRTTARALAGRIASLAPERETSAEIAEVVREVLISPRVLELEYVSRDSGERTRRPVEPLGMITVRGSWILVGWCRLRQGVRGFVTEQIASIRTTAEVPPVRAPDPFDADLARWDFLGYDR